MMGLFIFSSFHWVSNTSLIEENIVGPSIFEAQNKSIFGLVECFLLSERFLLLVKALLEKSKKV